METFTFLHLLLLATGASFYVCRHYGNPCQDRPYYVHLVQQLVDDPIALVHELDPFPVFRLCSGTLVHQQWVLTAGDCYYDEYFNQTIRPLKVEFGTHHRRPAKRFQLALSDNLRRFNNVSGTDGIMLVRLPEPVNNSTPVQLPASSCTRPRLGDTLLVLNTHRRMLDSSNLSLYCGRRKVTDCGREDRSEGVFCAEPIMKTCSFIPCPTDTGGALVRSEGTFDVLYGVKVSGYKFVDVCSGPIRKWINDTINEL